MEVGAASTANIDPMMGPSGPQKPKKKRIRNWTAEDRAVHREFEKSRREAFSERLAELTTFLPMLKTEHRPSKHVIVDSSIAQHKAQQARAVQAMHAIQALMTEREDLLREVNSLRAMYQPGACVPRQAQPIDPAVLEMLSGRNELAAGPVRRSDQPLELPLSLAIHEKSLMPVSSGAPVPGHMSHPPLSLDHPSVSPHNFTNWAWEVQGNTPPPISLSTTTAHEASLLWDQSPGVLTTTPPRDVDSGYDTNPNPLIDDAALFWSQHPGSLTTTPPRDGDLPFSANLPRMTSDPSMLWAPNLAVGTTKPTNDATAMPQQVFECTNSFSNHELLPL